MKFQLSSVHATRVCVGGMTTQEKRPMSINPPSFLLPFCIKATRRAMLTRRGCSVPNEPRPAEAGGRGRGRSRAGRCHIQQHQKDKKPFLFNSPCVNALCACFIRSGPNCPVFSRAKGPDARARARGDTLPPLPGQPRRQRI